MATSALPDFSAAAQSHLAQVLAGQVAIEDPEPRCVADQIAAHVGALTPYDLSALIETVQHMLTVAADDAVAAYKLDATAVALAAVATLAEAAVKAATDAAAAAADHVPRMDYTLAEAGFQLSRGPRALQYELDAGIVIGTHKGTSHRISHAELQRQVLRDDGKAGIKKRKKKLPRSDKTAVFPLLKVA